MLAFAADATVITCRRASVTSAGYEKRPCVSVARGTTYPSTRTRTPETGLPFSSSLPVTSVVLLLEGVQPWRNRRGLTAMVPAGPPRATAARCTTVCLGVAPAAMRVANFGRLFGGGDSCFEAPSVNTWSSLATPPLEEVGVPPLGLAGA